MDIMDFMTFIHDLGYLAFGLAALISAVGRRRKWSSIARTSTQRAALIQKADTRNRHFEPKAHKPAA